MDYCAFDLFKRALSKYKSTTIDGFWKVKEKEWKLIPHQILPKILLSSKPQCIIFNMHYDKRDNIYIVRILYLKRLKRFSQRSQAIIG